MMSFSLMVYGPAPGHRNAGQVLLDLLPDTDFAQLNDAIDVGLEFRRSVGWPLVVQVNFYQGGGDGEPYVFLGDWVERVHHADATSLKVFGATNVMVRPYFKGGLNYASRPLNDDDRLVIKASADADQLLTLCLDMLTRPHNPPAVAWVQYRRDAEKLATFHVDLDSFR